MYLYIPLHTYDYPFIDDFPIYLPYPNHSKPGQRPCVANQIASGYSSVRYGQWLIKRDYLSSYVPVKETNAGVPVRYVFQNQRAYPHPPMISAWARLQVSLSCEDFHEKNMMLIILCMYIYNVYVKYICICTYDYVCLCMYKSWMLFEELNVILNMIETCLLFFSSNSDLREWVTTIGASHELWIQPVAKNQETHGNPNETSYGCFLY